VFREPFTFYLSREALRSLDAAFDIDLLSVVGGRIGRDGISRWPPCWPAAESSLSSTTATGSSTGT
jgi:hypothetical protein